MSAVALLLSGVLGVTCPTSPIGDESQQVHCPQVYQVFGSAEPEAALNIVVVSAGFTAEELFYFRCGAALMLHELLSQEPFKDYACHVNVYRMDLSTPTGGIPMAPDAPCQPACPSDPVKNVWNEELAAQQCALFAGEYGIEAPLYGKPMRGAGRFAGECMEIDLKVQMCPLSTPVCRVIWLDNEETLWPLTSCAPGVDVVVVIANLAEWAGGGMSMDVHFPLNVASMAGIADPANRSRLLIHEFGHAMGLLDEYSTQYPESDLPTFFPGRNIVEHGAGGFDEIGWSEKCDTPSPEAPRSGRCEIDCRKPECSDCPESGPGVEIGLREGGYYHTCDYYRAEEHCVMNDATSTRDYCAGCRSYLTETFEKRMNFPVCSAAF